MNAKAERAIQTLNKIAVAQLANANLTSEYKLCTMGYGFNEGDRVTVKLKGS